MTSCSAKFTDRLGVSFVSFASDSPARGSFSAKNAGSSRRSTSMIAFSCAILPSPSFFGPSGESFTGALTSTSVFDNSTSLATSESP